MCARIKEPFEYRNRTEFKEKLSEWVGDVLFDILPDHEYEVRDEQIFTAYQIADAMSTNKIHLAEAGLGTGKTFAYLLSAIPYARMSKKPVVIACATTALQEQLASENGDVKTLSDLLSLDVDARMAKDPDQYVCDVKADESASELSAEVKAWLKTTTRGERSEMPNVSDEEWELISWEESMPCDTCLDRAYCKRMKAREYYRQANDLLIVDHATFFHDLWTRKELIADGKMPILPEYSAVIFDEGHKILLPAAIQAGNCISPDKMEQMLTAFEEIQGARNSLMMAAEKLRKAYETFFDCLRDSYEEGESSERIAIRVTKELLSDAKTFRTCLDNLLLEMQIEQELYIGSLPQSMIRAYESQIERATKALALFTRNDGKDAIIWVDEWEESFYAVPRDLTGMLKKELYDRQIPVVFTSATLSNDGDFSYFARTLGINSPSKSTVASPFNVAEQMSISVLKTEEISYAQKIEKLKKLLIDNKGHALVLCNSLKEVKRIRESLKTEKFDFSITYEDEGDRGYLVSKFREEESSVLVGADFWEGIDVPGEALTLVVIWQLPFPALDPLLEAQKKEAVQLGLDPLKSVVYPKMGLKLKQGCGRLIRSENDHGSIVVLDPVKNKAWSETVFASLPLSEGIKEL